MADEDSSWMLDDNDTTTATTGGEEVDEDSQETAEAPPVEAPKPPAEWRKTYKKDVSNLTAYRIFKSIYFVCK